ncbi:MAG TPA: SulP family inorganic anion transporter [Bacteroidia bacterium]
MVGGIVVAFFAGSRLTIKGPAAGLIVIASGAVAAFGGGDAGWHLALGAIVVAGLLQVLFGVFKIGSLSDFFPGAAIHGMLAAIGLIIISKQVHNLLGINPSELKGKEPLELYEMLPHSIMNLNAHITEIGVVCLIILIAFSYVKHKTFKKIPAPLVVLIIAIPLGIMFGIKNEEAIQNFANVKVGSIIDAVKGTEIKDGQKVFNTHAINVSFDGISEHMGDFVLYVILFALIGSIESLLTAKAIDNLDPYKRKSNFNKDLSAVGFGNVLSGILGGMPMISEVARSSANVSNGAKTRWANFFHGVVLLLALLLAVSVIEMIPNTALAAMLIFVGFKLTHPREFMHMWHVGKEQLAVFMVTAVMCLATDLLIGVGSGILLEIIINLSHGASFGNLFKSRTEIITSGDKIHVKISGDALFSNFLGLKKKIYALAPGKQVLLDLADCHVIDHTTLHTLKDFKSQYENEGGHVSLTGFELHKSKGHHEASTRVKK